MQGEPVQPPPIERIEMERTKPADYRGVGRSSGTRPTAFDPRLASGLVGYPAYFRHQLAIEGGAEAVAEYVQDAETRFRQRLAVATNSSRLKPDSSPGTCCLLP